MKRDTLQSLLAARRAKVPSALVTAIASGAQCIVQDGKAKGELALEPAQVARVEEAIAADRSGVLSGKDEGLFVQVLNPPLRMIVVGAVHIAQALAPMAQLAGYDVTIVDPRRAFAADARFPAVALRSDWPDDALRALAPDRRTAVIALTHDPKLDDPALGVALKSPAFYIGALGSSRTHARRLERLAHHGLSHADLARIHGPIGLAIGAKTPAEIAISILAQMTQALRGAAPEAA
jgi:xanthine dehydrogenase accessory factor